MPSDTLNRRVGTEKPLKHRFTTARGPGQRVSPRNGLGVSASGGASAADLPKKTDFDD
jgi:hypothetical protein